MLAAASPNLQYLILDGQLETQTFPPLPNLKTIYLALPYINNGQLVQLSAAAPQLLDLTLTADGIPENSTIASFPALKKIYFAVTDWDIMFNFIDAPQLQSFISTAGPFYTEYSVNIASQQTPRIYPSLTYMRLDRGMAERDEHGFCEKGFGLFRQAPNLTCLELTECAQMSQVLEWLRDSTADEDDILLRKLKTVMLTGVRAEDFWIIKEFVEQRSQALLPLQELKLDAETIEAMGPALVQKLSQLVTVSTVKDEDVTTGDVYERRVDLW